MSTRIRTFLALAVTTTMLGGIALVTTVTKATTVCDRFGSAHQGSYVGMNSWWNPAATGQQCDDVTSNGSRVSVSPDGVPTNGPNAYPAASLGCHHAANCGDKSPLPRQLNSTSSAPGRPSTPGSQVSKADVLTWLSNLRDRRDSRVVSGFFGGYSGSTFNLDQTNQLKSQSGQYPGMLACDYGNWVTSANTQVDTSCNNTLKGWWQKGGLVSVGIHMPSPSGGGFDTKLGNFADVTNSGTDVGRAWQDSLKKIGDGLSDLKKSGVVVMWRPFHEMNGDWFWWGNQDADTFRNAWNYMYNYLVKTRGLDNLIWVYAPDCSRSDSLTDYYPGGNKVDVVGLDCYTDNPSGGDGKIVKNLDAQYNQMLGLGKPFAFTETGPRDQVGGSFDWKKWIDAIQRRYPKTTYFLAWNDKWGPPQNQNSTGLMNHPWVINRGGIDLTGGATRPNAD
ncbi:glycosyl hydrolase [Actinopolymorpha alba]|uniref:glycosyl hydrolase n=1 Tax=Actinopolymorpha alba TaxID=533267 RepID=UPI0003721778|nr:glycosyl hydrolase [Actinopolymorpha alba]